MNTSTTTRTTTTTPTTTTAPTTTTTTAPAPGRFQRSRDDLNDILDDPNVDRSTRLLRLQGWRDQELEQAVAAGSAHRFAPGFCAIGAGTVALTASAPLAFALMATAVIGMFAANHPVEALYNRLARRRGCSPIPRNRAAKRLGCAIGTTFLGGSALAIAIGASLLGRGIAATFAVVAGFVAISNVCVPSLIYVTLWGSDRSTECKLF